ncbi:hypothetical protein BOW53_14880 [Solemya pervernicosa gill symbiont]|uniref:Uncharacterized protein n=2 Tax=Gammaproteobacteria incertae sedis TaxID=118884 RepID=A0A1T2L0L4_9GAMM|nr:tetratricopeptide repeat protein [Candidatus Reidiella endopervernicosa]OOZ38621.1 hypothetical protein BOW53_14880 [Solemya pervernicosa gill symbiont]QKQ25997.1 tetratricopeptide repeat protein [Candidatus Reidiella endopervernicosa]
MIPVTKYLRAPLLLLICGWLSACAQLPEQTQGVADEGESEKSAVTTASPDAESASGSISPELLYTLLIAEVAGQRKDYGLAVAHYIKAAYLSEDPQIAKRATRTALFARNGAAAIDGAKRWVELAPEAIDARHLLVVLALRSGDEELALDNLEAMVAQDGEAGVGRALNLASASFANNEERKRALLVMGKLAQNHPENASVHYAFANLALSANQAKAAVEGADQALTLKPGWPEARSVRGRALIKLGDVDAGLAVLAALVDEMPDSELYRLTYARALLVAERQSDALKQFQILTEKNPDNSDVAFAYGLLLIDAGEVETAKPVFQGLIERRQRLHDAHYFLGRIEEQLENHRKAIDHYAVVVAGERLYDAQLRVARLWYRLGNLDKGREHLKKLRDHNPEFAVPFFEAEAALLQDSGAYEEAMKLYDEALLSHPENADLLYARALTAEKIGRIDLLERDLRKILEKNPEDTRSLNALGYTLVDKTERYQEAKQLIEHAYRLQPKEPSILDSMGWLNYRLGNHEQAIDFLRKALSNLQDGEIAAHLGEVLWVSGEQDEARQIWKKAIDIEPDNKILKRVMERFLK